MIKTVIYNGDKYDVKKETKTTNGTNITLRELIKTDLSTFVVILVNDDNSEESAMLNYNSFDWDTKKYKIVAREKDFKR